LSSIVYIILYEYSDVEEEEIFDHPYPMAALISAFSFLLIFRANFAYHRYWEAQGQVHLMHSKWLDFATEVAAFHYQSQKYNLRKPPAFGAHPNLTSVTRERERTEEMTKEELEEHIDKMDNSGVDGVKSLRTRFRIMGDRLKGKKRDQQTGSSNDVSSRDHRGGVRESVRNINKTVDKKKKSKANERFDENGNPYSTFKVAARRRLREGHLDPDHPPLFLEEAAHLLSLLSAVAMSTLRNDLEEAESPLAEFRPGAPWPHVDPDAYTADVRKGWARSSNVTILRYLCGISRTDGSRTLYNAARPFRVIGNVSDAEIELLQAARGPQAKVALCSMWLQEFISREYLSGSTGNVAPPIISRLYQFVSDGMAGYNQARKIAYIPFPFPHAQITTLFVLVIVGFIPVLMLTYLTNEAFGFVLNMCTVMCFTGLHEVARELENPFQNVPNDIPLNNFQAQFNEGLMVMFFGYHPDAYWEAKPEEGSFPQARNDEVVPPDESIVEA
jgi:predicted membrane chloride channel (bestrophin family)